MAGWLSLRMDKFSKASSERDSRNEYCCIFSVLKVVLSLSDNEPALTLTLAAAAAAADVEVEVEVEGEEPVVVVVVVLAPGVY
jgi:hypothetical protein